METKNVLLTLAILVFILSVANASVTFYKVKDYNNKITGYATTGYVNLTISSVVLINVSQDRTNWGNGYVNGSNNATLQTKRNSAGVVYRGNWSAVSVRALVVQNLGSVNVSLNVSSNKNDTQYFTTGTNSRKRFWYNFTNKDTGACNYSSTTVTSTWYNVTTAQRRVCDKLRFGTGTREIYVDTFFMVPDDTTASANTATFTFTGTAISTYFLRLIYRTVYIFLF